MIQAFGYQKHKKQYKELILKEKLVLIILSLCVPFLGSVLYVYGATDEKNKRRISIGHYAIIGFIPLFFSVFTLMTLKLLKVI